MEVLVIGLILTLCILFGIGYFIRKGIYSEVDRLEALKIEMMNRSIVDEMSKVKDLKMTGQAEKLFEEWRKEWDEIITSQLPEVEELLFDAEDYADKYRFKKAKSILAHIEAVLNAVDESIDKIISEINELVTSEKRNRVEIEEVKQHFKKAKKTLIAHGHLFGKSHEKLEAKLYKIAQELKRFDVETDEGNYLAAREILLLQKEELDTLLLKIDEIPKLLTDCQTTIPNQINELTEGYNEMLQQGYHLEHIQIEQEINTMNNQLEGFRSQLTDTEIVDIHEGIQEIQDSIDMLYDLLEREVHANHFVHTAKTKIADKINNLVEQKKITKEETELVKQSYFLAEQELEKQRQIEKQINQLEKKFSHIQQNLTKDHIAHTIIKEELEDIEKQIEGLVTEHAEYREMLQTLRKDELQARQKLSELKRLMLESVRLVQQSNVPGLPLAFVNEIDVTKSRVQKVTAKLNEMPLDMVAVNTLLEDAVECAQLLHNDAEEMIEQVYLVEKVIQYGNRYRNRNSSLASQLIEAEHLFRKYEYGESLEAAAAALEQVEPGSLKRIQSIIQQEDKK